MKRRHSKAARNEEIVRKFSEIQAEGGGRWNMSIISCVDVLKWYCGGGAMDQDMKECLAVISPAIRQLETGERPDFACLLCGDSFGAVPPIAFIVLRALTPEPKSAILQGLCLECATKPDAKEQVFAFYKENIMPDFRIATIMDMPAGKM